ncbi:MAG TPA: GvpL/GvpF family gas vesicle protein [Candidatus Angelobacter sp.]|nr:GvpL/GvpF family gas vesicle protein [Candidatus Angelobacter sp.]
MKRALAYCAFQHGPEISLPQTGVNTAPVQMIVQDGLALLWSQVEWPFAPADMQKNAVEFHHVIQHIFQQSAVVPFRLLSVFDDERSLRTFVEENALRFLADLERLKNFVQMECVVYPARESAPRESSSPGKMYLERKAGLLRRMEQHEQSIRDAIGGLSSELRVRDSKNGRRMFVLVERGKEKVFRAEIKSVIVPAELSQRISGPWPAAEFLSEPVKAPQLAGTP